MNLGYLYIRNTVNCVGYKDLHYHLLPSFEATQGQNSNLFHFFYKKVIYFLG